MTTESDNLILERLRIMRQEHAMRFDQIFNKVDTLTAEVRINNAHVAVSATSVSRTASREGEECREKVESRA